MKYLYKVFLFLILISLDLFAGEIRDKAISFISSQFNDNIKVTTYKFTLPVNIKSEAENYAKQRFFGKFIYYYEITFEDEVIGYAILDNVLGKVKPITFLVVFDKELTISAVDIIKYREQYGGAISNREWLDQFNSKNLNSELSLNSEIDGISGATISVKSVIAGVNKILFLINNLSDDEKDLFVSVE